jgi:hypothetical protein
MSMGVSSFGEEPENRRQRKPRQGSCDESHAGIVTEQKAAEDEGEKKKGDGAEGGACGLDAGSDASESGSVVASVLLPFSLVIFNERDRSGEDGWKREEETADDGAVSHGDDAGRGSDDAAEEKT